MRNNRTKDWTHTDQHTWNTKHKQKAHGKKKHSDIKKSAERRPQRNRSAERRPQRNRSAEQHPEPSRSAEQQPPDKPRPDPRPEVQKPRKGGRAGKILRHEAKENNKKYINKANLQARMFALYKFFFYYSSPTHTHRPKK